MSEILLDARPALHAPARFVTEALVDLKRSLAVAWPLFRSNFRTRHRRAWLGHLWLLLPTIGTTAVWWYVHSRRIIDVAATPVPYPLYVFAGMLLWQVFHDALHAPLQQLTAGRQLVTRSRVPHEALILAGVLDVLLSCGVRLVLLVPMLAFSRIVPGPALLLVPVGILALLLLGLAIGVAAAPFGLLYDDVGRAMTLGTGFLFFLTPVFYRAPASGVLRLNPVTPLLETTRGWLTSSRGVSGGFFIVIALTSFALVCAWVLYRIARPHVVVRLG